MVHACPKVPSPALHRKFPAKPVPGGPSRSILPHDPLTACAGSSAGRQVRLSSALSFQCFDAGPVGTPSLTIYDPSPFIEILDKAADVDQQHFPVFTRSGLVGMYDVRIGSVHGTGNAVDTTRKIDILGVHEIALVEKPRLFQRPDSQEHEAT